jgi:hypothetical protein
VRRIHARAEGNPFFTAQLAQLLLDGDDPGAPVPAAVSDVVRQRLAGLPASTRELLQLCAVMGREVELAVLPTAASRSVQHCLVELEPAVAQRMLVELADRPGTLHFTHALVREVLVDDLPSVRRLSLHLQVADALEAAGVGDDHAELLAEHLWAAAPLGVAARAAESARRAADVAIRRFALRSAASLLARAADLHRDAGPSHDAAVRELEVVLRLTSVRRALDGFSGAADVHDRADELAHRTGDAVAQRELMWARWAAAITACDFATSEPIAQHLHQRAQVTDDPVERRLGLHVWAIQSWHHGRLLESAAAFEAAARTPAPEVDDRGDTLLSFERERLLVDRAFPPIVHEDLGQVESSRAELDRIAEGLDPYGDALGALLQLLAGPRGGRPRPRRRAGPAGGRGRDRVHAVVLGRPAAHAAGLGRRARGSASTRAWPCSRRATRLLRRRAAHGHPGAAGEPVDALLQQAAPTRQRRTAPRRARSSTATARAGRCPWSCWRRPSWRQRAARDAAPLFAAAAERARSMAAGRHAPPHRDAAAARR